jgi:hypothetical protein
MIQLYSLQEGNEKESITIGSNTTPKELEKTSTTLNSNTTPKESEKTSTALNSNTTPKEPEKTSTTLNSNTTPQQADKENPILALKTRLQQIEKENLQEINKLNRALAQKTETIESITKQYNELMEVAKKYREEARKWHDLYKRGMP